MHRALGGGGGEMSVSREVTRAHTDGQRVYTHTGLYTDPHPHIPPHLCAQLENPWQKRVEGSREGWGVRGSQRVETTLSPGQKGGRKGSRGTRRRPSSRQEGARSERTQDRREAEAQKAEEDAERGGGNQEQWCPPSGKGGNKFKHLC